MTNKLKGLGGPTITPYGGFVLSYDDVQGYLHTKCQIMRTEYTMPSLYIPKVWDTSLLGNYSRLLEYFRSRGIITLGLLASSLVPGAKQEQWNGTEEDWVKFRDAYIVHVTKIVQGSPRVSAWEVWNEPNSYTNRLASQGGKKVGGTYIPAERYAELLHAVVPILRQYTPHAMITTGGLLCHTLHGELSDGSAGTDYLDAVYRYYRDKKLSIDFDAVGFHPYIDQGGNFNQAHFLSQFSRYNNILQKHNDKDRYLWITEFGWAVNQVSESVQAANITALFATIGKINQIDVAIYFEYKDANLARLLYGLADSNGSRRAAYTEYEKYAPNAAHSLSEIQEDSAIPQSGLRI